jgi:hypothetical protein
MAVIPAETMPMNQAPTPEEIDNRTKFYTTVGQGISNWARMEGRIVHLGAELLDTNVEKAGVVFYTVTNFHVWLTIISELISLDRRLKDVKKDWNHTSNRLRELNDIRVRLAHHTTWHTDRSQSDVCLRPAKEDYRSKSRGYSNLTASEIIAFTRATTQMVPKLLDLQQRVHSSRMLL